MRTSQYLISTLKEDPKEAAVESHRLMLRAGLIRQIASGIYTWLPTGMRVLNKVNQIVREEMNKTGALEIAMPMVQPADLWKESGRYTKYGPELCRFTDRKENEFALGPTHEEVVTDIARREVKSARQLPLCLYQIQNKFRDEIRPRFGVMRGREFLMKDAYSFHTNQDSLTQTYNDMYDAYSRVFTRMGLEFRPVQADNGSIGGSSSHEFQALADAGEDIIAWSDASSYAANIEMAEALAPDYDRAAPSADLQEVATPNCKTVDEACQCLGVETNQMVKSLIVHGPKKEDGTNELVMLCLTGNHELNEVKALKIEGIADPLEFATEEEIVAFTGSHTGSLGPVGFKGRIIIDRTTDKMANFACGANKTGFHLINVNWDKDVPQYEVYDLRNVVEGDKSPDGKGTIHLRRGIEVGQVFMLGTKYSESMGATVKDEQGHDIPMLMGCYGIGVTRAIAAVIEQHHDDRGIIWPEEIAPFKVAIIGIKLNKSEEVRNTCESLYKELQSRGVEVLFDDRDERPGVMFADTELMGIPHIITVGEKALKDGVIEYKLRQTGVKETIALDGALENILNRLGK